MWFVALLVANVISVTSNEDLVFTVYCLVYYRSVIVSLQQTVCFGSLTSVQIDLCMWMSLSIHLHGLHLDAQYGQTTHTTTTITQWRENCLSASVDNHTIVTDPTIRHPGFDLPRHTWSLVNCFWTGQGACPAKLHKWGLAQSPFCECGQ